MEISKHKLVNFLFFMGFPCYGIGNFLMIKQNYSVGIIFSVAPFLAILLFYLVDMLYRGKLVTMVNRTYGLTMVYLLFMAAGYWISYLRGYDGLNPVNSTTQGLSVLIPFNAAIIVQIYNRANERFNFTKLVLGGLVALMLLNLVAYAGGVRAFGHSFEGRISFPFLSGIYDGAHILSVICLMLVFYLTDVIRRPISSALIAGGFVLGLLLMANVNSRLSIMIFFVLIILVATRSIGRIRGLFGISLFTMPLLMSFSLLVYRILSLPVFKTILGRVTKEDVTTFNGRTYIWEGVWDWFLDDRRGIIFGNGWMGQAHIGMLKFMEDLWEGNYKAIHLHSTFLEVLVDQGIIALCILYVLLYRGYKYYRREYLERTQDAPMFAGFVYLLFIWQIDIFCHGIMIGAAILTTLLAPICIRPQAITRGRYALDGKRIDSGAVVVQE